MNNNSRLKGLDTGTEKLRRVLNQISEKSLWASALTAIAMVTLVFLSTMARYVFGTPFEFTEEVIGLMFLVSAFLTLPYMTINNEHIEVTLVYGLLSEKGKFMLRLFAYTAFFIFASWFTAISWDFTLFSAVIEARSEVSDLLLFPWTSVMPIASGITAMICLVKILAMIWIALNKQVENGRVE